MTKRERGKKEEKRRRRKRRRRMSVLALSPQDCFSNFFNDINGTRALDSCEDNDGHFVGKNWMIVIREKVI